MQSEAEFQSNLIHSIMTGYTSENLAYPGMALYQNNWLENAHRALAVSFPTVQKLLGEDNFRAISKQACKHIPKTEYDWGDWGIPNQFIHVLSDCLEQQGANSLHYVVDCARLDERIFMSQRASDPNITDDAFAILSTEQAADAILITAETACIERFQYPVEKLYKYSHFGEGNIEDIRSLLLEPIDVYVQISRSEYKPYVESVSKQEYDLFGAAQKGQPVSVLFDLANEMNVDFSQWLSSAISTALIIEAKN